jgi:4-carboxymuconolactone decarboxylase
LDKALPQPAASHRISKEDDMKKYFGLALLGAALLAPGLLAAADNGRFPSIAPDQYTAKQKEFAKVLADSPRAGNVANPPFKVYFRSPEFAVEAIKMSDYLRYGTGLESRLSELAIIIAARNWDNDYIWSAHYGAAVKGGLDPSVGADMAAGKRPAKMKDDEAIIYDLLTEIYRDHRLSDATYAKTVAKYGEKGLVDLIGLASYYGFTAMALISTDAERPLNGAPKLQRVAQAFPK